MWEPVSTSKGTSADTYCHVVSGKDAYIYYEVSGPNA